MNENNHTYEQKYDITPTYRQSSESAVPSQEHRDLSCVSRDHHDISREDKIVFLSSPDLYTASSRSVQHEYIKSEQTKLKNEPASAWKNLVSVFFFNVILGYHVMTFGVYYVEFTSAFDTTKAIAGAVSALHGFAISFIGLFASVGIKLFDCKTCAVAGCLAATAGIFASAFAPTIQFLYVSYGFVCGSGFSFLSLSAMTIIQMSFNKHRAVATAISVSGIPLGNLIAPIATTYLIETFGWRGTLMLHSGILFNLLVCIMLWQNTTSSISDRIPMSVRVMVKNLFDFSILKNKTFVCYTIASIFIRCNTVAYFEHFISRAVFYGMDLRMASVIITYLCLCSFLSRTSMSILLKFVDINPLAICATIGIMQGLMSFAVTLSTDYAATVVCSIVFGLGQGGQIIQALLCVVKIAGVDNFARSRAVWNMFVSLAALITTPFTGWIFDVTQNYNIPFYISGAAGLAGSLAVLMLLVVVAIKDKLKNTSHTEDNKLQEIEKNMLRNGVAKAKEYEQSRRVRTYTF